MPFASLISTSGCTTTQSSDGPCTFFLRPCAPNCRGRRATTRGIQITAQLLRAFRAISARARLKNFSSKFLKTRARQSKRFDVWITLKKGKLYCLLTWSLFAAYRRSVLEKHRSTGLDDMGPIKGSLALCVFAVFLLVYFSLWKGVKSTGKVRLRKNWFYSIFVLLYKTVDCWIWIKGIPLFEKVTSKSRDRLFKVRV